MATDPEAGKFVFTSIGTFVYFFSQIEMMLRAVLAEAIALPPELFYPITAPYDFRALCDVTLAAFRFWCTDPAMADKFAKS